MPGVAAMPPSRSRPAVTRRWPAAARRWPRAGGRAPATRRLPHVRIAVVGRRHERLLDGAGAHPAQQVELRARLVVRAAGPRAAERLLADHRTGRLVVDVEVPG